MTWRAEATRRTRKVAAVCVVGFLLAGCAGRAPLAERRPLSSPPSHQEIIRTLLRIQDVELNSDRSCSGVGAEASDTTIGDYVSGLLAEFTSTEGKSWMRISSRPEPTSERGQPVWDVRVEFLRANGVEEWAWGVAFAIRGSDGTVVDGSIRCIGAG